MSTGKSWEPKQYEHRQALEQARVEEMLGVCFRAGRYLVSDDFRACLVHRQLARGREPVLTLRVMSTIDITR